MYQVGGKKMSNALTVYQDGGFEIMRQTAGVFSRSKFFENAEDEAKAMVKIMAGAELGIQPFAAMTGIHVIKGKPALGANIIAALIKSSGRYNYRVVEHTEAVCRIQFFEKINGSWEKIGISDYTSQEAQRAGVQNMQKFPKNMLFARAISNGARWHCPDIFAGAPVYTADELGVQVDEDGVIIESTYTEAPAQQPQPVRGEEFTDKKYADGEGVTVKALPFFNEYFDAWGESPDSADFLRQWVKDGKPTPANAGAFAT
jgi:hypothetical protein